MEDEDIQPPECKPLVTLDAPKERSATPVRAVSPAPPAGEPEAGTPESQLSASLLADLVSMKSKMSAAEMRYRKFQRRNPLRKLSLQIDDVIMEEDEEALEREAELLSSDDELGLGKFRQVLGSSNLAEEILSEIYGEGGGGPRRTLAEEILEELYGSTTGPDTTLEEEEDMVGEEVEEEENRYCSIDEVLEVEERPDPGEDRPDREGILAGSH
jgi:hypothetical protein